MFQKNERKKKKNNPETRPDETEVNNLLDRKFKAIVIKMITEQGKIIDKKNENFNKGLEDIKKEPVRAEEYND